MNSNHRIPSMTNQRGAALLVAVVLLLLAGIMTLLALNVGLFESRSTGNDVRAKLVNEVAEAGLSQGFEYLLRQHPEIIEDDTQWEACGATDATFPCGAITAATYDHDANATTAPIARRASMWRLRATGNTITGIATELSRHMLPLANEITQVGSGFSAAYGVAPLMCFVMARTTGELSTAPVRCASTQAELAVASSRRIGTFVSVAAIPGEAARTTLTQTVGRYALIDTPTGKPPIIASGSVDVTGTLQIVTNPNAGGAGVPVSVWTRKDVNKTGTPNTCYADEFFRFGAKNNAPPTIEGSTIVCDTCQCNGDKSLSYDKSGNVQDEGIDILDVEGTSASNGSGINYNVRSDQLSYPTCEFPPDLFAYIFGVQAWRDTDSDCFAETKVTAQFTNPNTGAVVTIGADEAFLYANALAVINPTVAGAPLVAPGQTSAYSYPSTQQSGLIWCQSNCDIGSNTQLGTPDAPVVLVIDGSARIQGRVFGLVFLRSTAGGNTLTSVAGYTMTSTEIANGGGATLDMNAGAAVYGAMVIHGQINKANGTAAVIHDSTVLNNIGNNPNNSRYATLPGAWNDNSTY